MLSHVKADNLTILKCTGGPPNAVKPKYHPSLTTSQQLFQSTPGFQIEERIAITNLVAQELTITNFKASTYEMRCEFYITEARKAWKYVAGEL